MRVMWNEYEAALIVEMFYRIKSGELRKNEGASIVSERLRIYGVMQGISIDDKYRNINGILMQLNAIEYADSGGENGLSSCSKLFRKMVDLYKNQENKFKDILQQANKVIPELCNEGKVVNKGKVKNTKKDNMMLIEQLVEIVDEYFPYGFKTESPIALMRFRRFYGEKYNKEIEVDDERLFREIKRFCHEVDGKLYHISAVGKKYVDRLLWDIAKENNLIYYERLFELHNEDFLQHSILSPEILKSVVDGLLPTGNTKKNYFVIETENERITEKICLKDEVCRVWGEKKVRNYTYLSEHLPYVPGEKIKYVLAQSDAFIWNSTEEYTRTDLFLIEKADAEAIIERVKELCEINGSASFEELPLDGIINENYELSETAIYSYIFDNVLSGQFSRNGKVIRIASWADNAAALFQSYCREKNHHSIEELFSKWEEITGDNRRAHPLECAFEVLVRINEDEFVSDNSVHFDINKIDEVLGSIISKKYIGIKEITSFVAFPDCGYPWNLFLVESFCRRFSKKYKFVTKIASSKNTGAIVEKEMSDDFDEILIVAVAESGIELESERIFDFLIMNGYLYRHAYKGMDNLIYRANEMRERSK